MEMSFEVANQDEKLFKFSTTDNFSCSSAGANTLGDDSVINLNSLQFDDDETWLYKSHLKPTGEDICAWLRQDICPNDSHLSLPNITYSPSRFRNLDTTKSIDTRTFTRPKKKFTRPSIEKYNEELYRDCAELLSPENHFIKAHRNRESNIAEVPNENSPLQFDLTQSVNSHYFENILTAAGEVDCFQNMSPPSLVNSMCSSTFTNLMESSFIKNDPVLREIRDTDFTETILLQDCEEPSLFQSFSDSYHVESTENLLENVTLNDTFVKNLSRDDFLPKTCSNSTFCLENPTQNNDLVFDKTPRGTALNDSEEFQDAKSELLNESFPLKDCSATFKRKPRLSSATFRKSDLSRSSQKLGTGFDVTCDLVAGKTEEKLCSTVTLDQEDDASERLLEVKRVLTETFTDANRLNYNNGDTASEKITSNLDNNRINIKKRHSLGCLGGSADSIDRLSSYSSSSRGSTKMLNMEEVEAIVEMQEKSLQIMSTPKPNSIIKKILWENNHISPIPNSEVNSDSEASSNDDYKSVKSTPSKISLDGDYAKEQIQKPVNNIKAPAHKPRSINTLSNKNMVARKTKGSYTLLHGSAPAINKDCGSNLKTMARTLKGSYTSLKPISGNLPVAPPLETKMMDTTKVMSQPADMNCTQSIEGPTKIAQVPPIPRDNHHSGEAAFIKPLPPKSSGLPRPVGYGTGIPRRVSKIPGPRIPRPNSAQQNLHLKQQTNEEYY